MVDRAEVASKITKLIAEVSNRPTNQIKEDTRLKEDLSMTAALRAGLADSYTRICKFYGGTAITIAEASKFKTVKACIDLVFRRANTQ